MICAWNSICNIHVVISSDDFFNLLRPFYDSPNHSDTITQLLYSVNKIVQKYNSEDHELKLSEFGHYFAFIAAAAFAYTNLETIKSYYAKKTTERPDFIIMLKDSNDIISEANLVTKEPGDWLSTAIKDEIQKAKDISLLLQKVIKRNETIINGDSFNASFSLLGTIYLSYLVLIGYQRPEYDFAIYSFTLLILLIGFVQQLIFVGMLWKGKDGKRYWNVFRYANSTTACLLTYCVIFLTVFPLVLIKPCRYLDEWLFNENLFHHTIYFGGVSICNLLFNKFSVISLFLLLPLIPFITLLLRDFFINRYEESSKIFYSNLKISLDTITVQKKQRAILKQNGALLDEDKNTGGISSMQNIIIPHSGKKSIKKRRPK